jgi:hypothetical protein
MGQLPDRIEDAPVLQSIADNLITVADVNKQVLTNCPQDLIE